jgi:glutamyl-tRNA reductase
VTQARGPAASLDTMKLTELHVLHFDGANAKLSAEQLAAAGAQSQAWVLATCQRTVVVAAGRAAHEALAQRLPAAASARSFEAAEAYAFLLRFACGLESKLLGETEIFGQIKESWRAFSASASLQSRQLASCVQSLFQDTKEVRANQLSALGSASYGSQVRRLLGTVSAGPTLLVGAGQLAQSVAPWIETNELLLWNRTTDRAHEVAALVQERHAQRVCRVLESSLEAELAGWSQAGDVVICVPADATRDVARIAAWRARSGHTGRIVHLGLGTSGADPTDASEMAWAGVPGLTSLTALFDMLRAQSDLRRVQVTRARRACAEKAVLRSLGSNATQPHGWEDLAAFAAIGP